MSTSKNRDITVHIGSLWLIATMLIGERHPSAKLTEDDVRAIRASGDSISALSRRFGVARRNIRLIRERKAWIHVD